MKYSPNMNEYSINDALDAIANEDICPDGIKHIKIALKVFKVEENLLSDKNFPKFISLFDKEEEVIEYLIASNIIIEDIGITLPKNGKRTIFKRKDTGEVIVISCSGNWYHIISLTNNWAEEIEEEGDEDWLKQLTDIIGTTDLEVLTHVRVTKNNKKGKK